MAAVVIEALSGGDIVGMVVVDEVLDFFAILFLVTVFVFVVDFGFDIEESIASVAASLPAVALLSSCQLLPPSPSRDACFA